MAIAAGDHVRIVEMTRMDSGTIWTFEEVTELCRARSGNPSHFIDVEFSPDGKWLAASQHSCGFLTLHHLSSGYKTVLRTAGHDLKLLDEWWEIDDWKSQSTQSFLHPSGISWSPDGRELIVTDYWDSRIKKVHLCDSQ